MNGKKSKTFEQLAVENGFAEETKIKECLAELDGNHADDPVARNKAVEERLLSQKLITPDQARACRTALERFERDEGKEEQPPFRGYELLEKIGQGGLGTVYKARQISMLRHVALKVLHKKWLADEEFKKRFLLEARLAGRLSHQNLIQVYEVGRERGLYYFSMEFVDGETVEDIIERQGPLEESRALDICLQVLRAITYLKRFDIVHRDIKPGNIMLTRSGQVKLGDFGFVKSKYDHVLSTEGEVLGTPDYISPEQAMGSDDIDWRSDQYSLGCTLYHMLTGRPPYDGTASQVMRRHIKAELPDPRTINPKITEKILRILEKMIAKDPNDRYQDTNSLFGDIELIKLGQDPTGAQLDAGKSTIIRAFKVEKTRAERAKSEVDTLKDELNEVRRNFRLVLVGALVVIVALAIALVVVLSSAGPS